MNFTWNSTECYWWPQNILCCVSKLISVREPYRGSFTLPYIYSVKAFRHWELIFMIEFIMTVGKWTVPFVYDTRCTNKLIPCIYLFNVSELKWFNRVVALAFNPPFIEESHRLIVTYTSIAMEMLNYTITIKVNCWCTKVLKKPRYSTWWHQIQITEYWWNKWY